MGKAHRSQRSQSGEAFGIPHTSSKRKLRPMRNNMPFYPHHGGHSDPRSYERPHEFAEPPHLLSPWGRPAPPPPHFRSFGNSGNSPPLRPFPHPPREWQHESSFAEPFSLPISGTTGRGYGARLKRQPEYSSFHNKLFLDEYRFPGPQQMYQPPQFEGPANQLRRENKTSDSEDKPPLMSPKLRGDAPEFIPSWMSAVSREPKVKAKEPCWLVISSC